MRREDTRLLAGCVVAAVALGVASTMVLAGAGLGRHAFRPDYLPGASAPTACAAPALPGQVVEVTTTDMGPGGMGDRSDWGDGGRDGQGWMRLGPPPLGSMRLTASPSSVSAGPVSLRVSNEGQLPHKVVVLPLGAGQGVGQRATGPNGRVDTSGSLGEASRSCGAGAGDGIGPGDMGWTTLNLRPGRYELVCDLPGHYAAGMHTELDVT